MAFFRQVFIILHVNVIIIIVFINFIYKAHKYNYPRYYTGSRRVVLAMWKQTCPWTEPVCRAVCGLTLLFVLLRGTFEAELKLTSASTVIQSRVHAFILLLFQGSGAFHIHIHGCWALLNCL